MDTQSGLTYEETPIIEPIAEVSPVTPQPGAHSTLPLPHEAFAPPHPKKSIGKTIGNILLFVLLFGLGIWLASQARLFISSSVEQTQLIPTPTEYVSPTNVPVYESSQSAVQPMGFVAYNIFSGSGKYMMPGVTFQLPTAVAAPMCDEGNCPSQGTMLPGGTRFTVAARGKGYLLPDFRGAILTDVAGREFVMKQSVVGGKSVYEYIGDFTGRTGGGYTFAKMRGVLVSITPITSVEFNHFAPVGQTTDFAADDVLFEKIIASVMVPATEK